MLAGAGLGDHARLAHAPRQHGLADGVVDLVRAGVVEVFALQVDLRAAEFAAQALRVIDRRGPADVVRQFVAELGHEGRIGARLVVGGLQFIERVDQRLGHEGAAIDAEMPRSSGCW